MSDVNYSEEQNEVSWPRRQLEKALKSGERTAGVELK
jgi:hypothetical protein